MLRTGSSLLKGAQVPAPLVSSRIRIRRSLSVFNAAMDLDKESPTVSAEWLKQRLGQPDIKVLDASWYMPVQARNGLAEFKAKRIPGARFFDIDGISDPKTDLPHMLPSNAAFSHAMDALGVAPTDTVVVYDGMGCFSAPRAWWTLKAFGHEKVYVLDGGLPAWEAVSGPVDAAPADEAQIMEPTQRAKAAQAPGIYPAKLDTNQVRSLSQMLANVGAPGDAREQMVDARSHGRFIGVEPEPRAGLRGGHIPGAKNVPFPSVLESGRLKPADDLKAVFEAAGIDLNQPLVGSCGSGLTACVLALAVHKATGGSKLIPVYDGSWCEWGGRDDVPISTTEP